MGKFKIENLLPQEFKDGRSPLLELCPFCGEPAEIHYLEESANYTVQCLNSECAFQPKNAIPLKSELLAIKTWNTRKGGI